MAAAGSEDALTAPGCERFLTDARAIKLAWKTCRIAEVAEFLGVCQATVYGFATVASCHTSGS